MRDRVSEVLDRPPRIRHSQISGEINLPAPPTRSENKTRSLLMSIVPVMSMGVLGIFYIFSSRGGSGGLVAMPMLIMGGIAFVMAILTFSYQTIEHEREFARRRRDYNRQLDRRVERLQAARELQMAMLQDTYPGPEALIQRVTRQDLSLWGRRAGDDDFLQVRLGRGDVASRVSVSPTDPDVDAPDIRRSMTLAFDYRELPEAPLTINLLQTGSLGLVGRHSDLLQLTYSLIAQLTALHQPTDLNVYIFAPQVAYRVWAWSRWLPHTSKGVHGGFPDLIAFGEEDTRSLLDALARRVDARHSPDAGQPDESVLLVIYDRMSALKDEMVFKSLLESHESGVISLCLVDEMGQVPAECRGVLEVDEGSFTLSMTGPEGLTLTGTPETISRAQVESVARQLTNFTLPTAGDSGRVPARSNFLQMFDVPSIPHLDIAQRWRRPVPASGNLPFGVPLGHRSFSSFLNFDLSERAHGPHGVVAGTTGSGKSELLQTLVASMATEHHPYLVNFLLVDYKGGATFNIFRELPHTAGIITNLNVVEALRALEAIKSENRRRQIFLSEQNAEDIKEYHKRLGRVGGQFPPDWQPLPHLVIIIDEFAELKSELPNFLDELVATVRVGRSLGMHLILATQRPAGHVTQEMSANLNFRISLRVQNPEESREMLRRPDAAYIPPSVPGRAYFLAGNDLQEFQSAWVGMEYDEADYGDIPDEPEPELRILRQERPLNLRPAVADDAPAAEPEPENGAVPLVIPTLAEALSAHLTAQFAAMDARPTETVFLESLPDALPLDEVLAATHATRWNGAGWDEARTAPDWRVPVGRIDDIPNRSQPPLWVDFHGQGGHILVAGGPGTGKTTFLRSLAMSLAHLYRPDEVEIYVLSMTGRVLDLLAELPHVGAVVRNDENERIERLFRRLVQTLEQRRYALAQVSADDLLQYNLRIGRQGGQPLPAIYVLIDNFLEVQKVFQDDIDALATILRDCRAVGIYFAMTTPTVSISYKLLNLIQQRFALRLTERADYLQYIGRTEGREVNPRAGSGLLSGKPPQHCQLALPGSGDDDEARLSAMQATIESMRAVWGDRPSAEPIVTLPANVLLSNLLDDAVAPASAETGIRSLVGLEGGHLQPHSIDWLRQGPHFLINGPVGSGKSSALMTLLLGVAHAYAPSDVHMLLLDFSQQSLRRLGRMPHVIAAIADEEALAQQLEQLNLEISWRMDELRRRNADGADLDLEGYGFTPIIIAIDDYDQLRDALSGTYSRLTDLSRVVRADTRLGIHFLIAGETASLTSGSDKLIKQIKLMRSGLALVTAEAVEFMGGRVTRAMRLSQLPDGRGYLMTRSTTELIQLAHTQHPADWVQRIRQRWPSSSAAAWTYPVDYSPDEPAAPSTTTASSSKADDSFSLDFEFDLSGALEDYKRQQSESRKTK